MAVCISTHMEGWAVLRHCADDGWYMAACMVANILACGVLLHDASLGALGEAGHDADHRVSSEARDCIDSLLRGLAPNCCVVP